MNHVPRWVGGTWEWVQSIALSALGHLDELRMLTPSQATVVIFVATVVIALVVVGTWMQHCEGSIRKTALAAVSVPVFLALMLQVPGGFHGTPDDRCAAYNGGRLTFVLLDKTIVPRQPEDIYGTEWLIILVRAPERWGNETHQCRLSMSDAKAERLYNVLEAYIDGVGGTNGRGIIHFTFGPEAESPNAKFIPFLPPLLKDGPPEVPERQKRDL